ncbi:MAG: alpha-galactosidase [Lachnospiraceae bacterium]|nr:alpha-galactosidase [Lachnospiraceae bacterium]
MAIEEISRIQVGDMILKYELETDYARAGFSVIPADMNGKDNKSKFYRINSLIQMKLIGDMYPNCYGHGSSMRNGESSNRLEYKSQIVEEREDVTIVKTFLEDKRGYKACNVVTWYEGDDSFEMKNIVENISDKDITLEMLSSFELGNISPFLEGDGPDSLLIHRLRSKWSHEGRLCTDTIEDLQLEPSWSTWSASTERFGQTGSMPVKKFFPFVAVEDKINQVLWGVQLAHEASWQMEVYRQDDALHISGGLADREFGHWTKILKKGETFETPTAIISVCHGGGIDRICQRLTQSGEKYLRTIPESEEHLPIIFNEYCTTWGCPSHENIAGIINAIKDKGFEYFVIDCGWFKEDNIPWDISMGDYNVSPSLFPQGLEKTVELIKNAGMKPGIWFEIDNIGSAAKAYHMTEHQLKRDGYPISTYSRRFWDMNDSWVQDYLSEKVIGTLKKYGFEYMKMDYNDTIGIGCDGCESLGEGLRKNMSASVNFVKKVSEEIPGIILENCSSGGHKLEPLMMSLCSMASFSDAHECEEIPVIAANLHRAILPRQSQIWAVIRKTDSLKRIAYSIANTFLGRMCLSGDVTELTKEQWDIIDNGIAFYKKIAPIIKEGYTYRFGPKITSERHLKGWQGVVRTGKNGGAYALIHVFHEGFPEVIEIELPEGCATVVADQYSDSFVDVKVEDGVLKLVVTEEMKAVAVLLEETNI